MIVTIFISGVTGGGAEKVSCAIASFLVSKGHKVELLTMSNESATYPLDKRVSRYCLLKESERKNFLLNNIIRFARFVKYLLGYKPDVYLAMLPRNIITMLSMKFLTSAKVIAAERATPASYKQKIQKKLLSLASKADGWVFQTNEQKDWYTSRTSLDNPIVIPNAINTDVLKQGESVDRSKTIVSAGRLTDQKNHELLINAFARIAEKHSDYNLMIYGEGPNRKKLSNQISRLNLNNRVFLHGYSSDVVSSVSKSSLFVLSSDFEGMPNALMEAMAMGVPSISTDCGGGGAKFLIENEKNGLLVPIGDVDALASAMDRVLSDRAFSEKISKNARTLCKTLAPDVIYGQWERFLDEIVNIK